jgi:hypothetical protein
MSMIALIVVGSIATVLVILRASLYDELDKQLLALTRERIQSSAEISDEARSETSTRLPDMCVPDPATSRAASGAACSVSGSGEMPQLAPEMVEAHATDQPAPFEPFDAEGDDGQDFRVTAVRIADGRIVVTSVSTAHIDATFQRVAVGAGVVGLGLLTAMVLVAWWVERLGVLPIRRVGGGRRRFGRYHPTGRPTAIGYGSRPPGPSVQRDGRRAAGG